MCSKARVAVLGLFLAACSGPPVAGVARVETPLSPLVRAHKALLVSSKAARADLQGDAKAIAINAAHKVEKLPYFAIVMDQDHVTSACDLELVVDLAEVVKVTAVEREAKGKGAGEVKVVANVRLLDCANHALLGSATMFAAGYSGPNGGTTADAEEVLARQVFEWVSGRGAEAE